MSQVSEQVFESRWGFHPVSYQTFVKLRYLNKVYSQALTMLANHQRWERKLPKNRLRWRKIKNEKNQPIGWESRPWPEPETCPVMFPWNLFELTRKARTPASCPEEVEPFPLSEERVEKMYQEAKAWEISG